MFEAQIAYYLNEYLGKYVEGIDRKSLTCVSNCALLFWEKSVLGKITNQQDHVFVTQDIDLRWRRDSEESSIETKCFG